MMVLRLGFPSSAIISTPLPLPLSTVSIQLSIIIVVIVILIIIAHYMHKEWL